MESLTELENNIHRLLERIDALEQEVITLNQRNDEQRQEIVRSHAELARVQDAYRKLQITNAMLGSEDDRVAAKSHLTNMIAQLDRAIEILKQ